MNQESDSSKITNLEHTIEVAEELSHEMELLAEEVHKQNSRSRIFWNGIISGLGRVVGATIIFAIFITILGYALQTSDIEWLNTLVTWLGLNAYLN